MTLGRSLLCLKTFFNAVFLDNLCIGAYLDRLKQYQKYIVTFYKAELNIRIPQKMSDGPDRLTIFMSI